MAKEHFLEQQKHARDYLVPYFEAAAPDFTSRRVLEVGCAEGGCVDVLRTAGCTVTGLELKAERAALAIRTNPALDIRTGDIAEPCVLREMDGRFGLIIMRDVIEHIPDREAAFRSLSRLLSAKGLLYITFPPRFSPFAGHQQHGRTLLGRTPYLHLIPAGGLRTLGKWFGEDPAVISAVIENYRIGLSIGAFERLMKRFGFVPVRKELFLIRPAFQTRYGFRPRRMGDIPVLREILSMGCECLLRKSCD